MAGKPEVTVRIGSLEITSGLPVVREQYILRRSGQEFRLHQRGYPKVTTVAERPEETLALLRARLGKDIWLFGGAETLIFHPSDTSGSMSALPRFASLTNERIDGLSSRSSKSSPSLVRSDSVVLSRAPRRPPSRTRFAQWLHADHPQSIPQLSHRLRRGWKGKPAPSSSHRRRYASTIRGSGYGGYGRDDRDFDPAWRFCRAVPRACRPVF